MFTKFSPSPEAKLDNACYAELNTAPLAVVIQKYGVGRTFRMVQILLDSCVEDQESLTLEESEKAVAAKVAAALENAVI